MIKTFDSIAALLAYGESVNALYTCKHDNSGLSWYGDETPEDTKHKTRLGDTSLVPEAERLLDKLDQTIETTKREWDRSPAGAFIMVPEAIVGLPTPARRAVYRADEHSPITILVCSSSSAGIRADTLMKRGTTVLALTMALARIRPVSLWTVATLHGADTGETVLSARITTDPLDLATAAYVLTSAGFARRLTYGIGYAVNDFNGHWPRQFGYGDPAPYYKHLAETLSPDPSRTLVIGAAQLGDELLQTPLVWIDKQIKRFTTQVEEELVQ